MPSGQRLNQPCSLDSLVNTASAPDCAVAWRSEIIVAGSCNLALLSTMSVQKHMLDLAQF